MLRLGTKPGNGDPVSALIAIGHLIKVAISIECPENEWIPSMVRWSLLEHPHETSCAFASSWTTVRRIDFTATRGKQPSDENPG